MARFDSDYHWNRISSLVHSLSFGRFLSEPFCKSQGPLELVLGLHCNGCEGKDSDRIGLADCLAGAYLAAGNLQIPLDAILLYRWALTRRSRCFW